MCLPMWPHWRHLTNATELVLPSAHSSTQTKRQINRFGRSCTVHSKTSLHLQPAFLSPKIAPSDGCIWTRLTHGSLGPPESSTHTTSWPVQPFSHRRPQSVPILYNGMPLPMGNLDPHLIHGSLSSPESSTHMVSRSVQPFLQGSLVWQTDRHTTLLGR